MKTKWTEKANFKHFLGLSLGAAASFFYALGNSTVQYVLRENKGSPLSVFQLVFVRSLGVLTLVGIVLAVKRINPYGGSLRNFGLLCLLGAAKISSIIFYYISLTGLPLGDATVILFIAPVFTVFLGIILLKEKCSLCNITLGLLSFLGVAIIAAPGVFFPGAKKVNSHASHTILQDKNVTYVGLDDHDKIEQKKLRCVGFAIGSAMCLSFHFIILREATQRMDPRISLFYPSIFGVLIAPILMAINQDIVMLQALNVESIVLMFSTGFTYFAAMMILAYALLMEEAGPVALMRNAEVIFAIIFEITIERQIPMVFSVVGVVMILCTTTTIFVNRIFNVEKKIIDESCCSPRDGADGDGDEKIPKKAGYKPVPKDSDD
jgi:Permeases of the drug/metabolite transporter (DMT) superfamily